MIGVCEDSSFLIFRPASASDICLRSLRSPTHPFVHLHNSKKITTYPKFLLCASQRKLEILKKVLIIVLSIDQGFIQALFSAWEPNKQNLLLQFYQPQESYI